MSDETIEVRQPFNIRQWAADHDRRDNERFSDVTENLKTIWKIFGVAGLTLISVMGWSLKAQYDNMSANQAHAEEQLRAIYTVQRQVQAVNGQAPVPNR